MQTEAAIDNDFILHLAGIKDISPEEHIRIVRLLFDELSVKPIMHELVFKNELFGGADTNIQKNALKFFEEGIIEQKMLSQIVDTDSKRRYYKTIFEEIYRDFKGDIPEGINDVLVDWKSKASFGETHTVVMCLMINSSIFLSDDMDSKRLAYLMNSKTSYDLKVYNRAEACERIKELGSTKINKKIRRKLSHEAK